MTRTCNSVRVEEKTGHSGTLKFLEERRVSGEWGGQLSPTS